MDDHGKEELHSIGTLSKIIKISTDTLRYYDEIGLVKPALISEQTGYRYYSNIQVVSIMRILELKQYGFSLNSIKEIITNDDALLIDIYKKRYFELLRERQKLDETINKIALKINIYQEGLYMNKSILIVDDSDFMRKMLKSILEKEGFTIAGEAVNGVIAVEEYNRHMPDAVLLDIVMPEMHGIEALKRIKEINKNAKVIMLSAMGQVGTVIEALSIGAMDFIVKPFMSEKLISAVNNVFINEIEFNNTILSNLFEKYADNTIILRQDEIDEIIKSAAINNADNTNADNIIKNAVSTHAPSFKYENKIQEDEIIVLLNKIIQGQDDIKMLLSKQV